ncbi:MAG: TlpA family protein disulfide reductase [Cyclobacteriaceae bacterium]
MKITLLIICLIVNNVIFAQNHFTVHLNPDGDTVSYDNYFSYIVSGEYKIAYNRKSNTRTLVASSEEKYIKEERKTEKRISIDKHIGQSFPSFELIDISGEKCTLEQLKGKVVVLNFWFIGCAPCEMERPVLNTLREFYRGNDDVVFLAFAKNEKEKLNKFLINHPVSYTVFPSSNDYLKTQFDIDSYPQNIILDRKGNYWFEGSGSGIGIAEILRRKVEQALVN